MLHFIPILTISLTLRLYGGKGINLYCQSNDRRVCVMIAGCLHYKRLSDGSNINPATLHSFSIRWCLGALVWPIELLVFPGAL